METDSKLGLRAALKSLVPTQESSELIQSSVPGPAVLEARSALQAALAEPASTLVRAGTLALIVDSHLFYPRSEADAVVAAIDATAVLQNLEQTSDFFRGLADELVSIRHPRVSVSAYLSKPSSSKLGLHSDAWDNIVVQLAGRKGFHFLDAPAVILDPGSVLFIPQGVIHRVETIEESRHLSFVMLRSTSASSM